MTGHRPLSELTKDWSAEQWQRVNEEVAPLRREMELQRQRGKIPSTCGTSPCEGDDDSLSADAPSVTSWQLPRWGSSSMTVRYHRL